MPQARGTHFVVTKTDEAIQSSADHISCSCSLDKAQTVLHPPLSRYIPTQCSEPLLTEQHRARSSTSTPSRVQVSCPMREMRTFGNTSPMGRSDASSPSSIKLMLISPLTYALLPGFETRIDLKFRNREGNIQKDVSRNESQPRHVGSDEGRIRACYNAGIRDENTVPVG